MYNVLYQRDGSNQKMNSFDTLDKAIESCKVWLDNRLFAPHGDFASINEGDKWIMSFERNGERVQINTNKSCVLMQKNVEFRDKDKIDNF